MDNHIDTLNIMGSTYSHIRKSDSEFSAIEAAKEALREQAEREKGCEYCNNEKDFEIHFDGEKAGVAYLHKCSDGWGLFLKMGGGDTYYTDVNNCPKCGRRLKKCKCI